MGFERNYQVKIHSKQINLSKTDNRAEGASSTDVSPWFTSGLIDAKIHKRDSRFHFLPLIIIWSLPSPLGRGED